MNVAVAYDSSIPRHLDWSSDILEAMIPDSINAMQPDASRYVLQITCLPGVGDACAPVFCVHMYRRSDATAFSIALYHKVCAMQVAAA